MENDRSSTGSGLRIADLCEDDRPRERAIRLGVGQLSTAELIAIVLGSGMQGKSAIDLGREILACCDGDLELLSRMTVSEICRKFKGIGPAKAVKLAAAVALGIACSRRRQYTMPQICGSRDAYDYVAPEMAALDHEEFRILLLTRANRVRRMATIGTGGTNSTVVDVKILLKTAIDALAEGIILVHNHPSGTLEPSLADDYLTEKICKAAKLCDIKVMDHVIVSTQGYYSYADEGRLHY